MFTENDNQQAFLKAGIMGFAGSGKSTTASNIAVGLVSLLREKNIEQGDKPVFFLDTESGSDWLKPVFNKNNIKLMTAKTRAFKDLVPAIKETEKNGALLIIDSITHFWVDLTASYKKKKNRNRLTFGDWDVLKTQWRMFTDEYVNSQAHIIVCGRAGFEYEHFEDDDGKKQIEKSGIKMKAEGETGYEASLLILMERNQRITNDGKIGSQWRTANILKDRSQTIDGMSFDNPNFNHFSPHINFLNLGSRHEAVDVDRDSVDLFNNEGKPQWQWEKEQKNIALEEIKDLLVKHYPSQSVDDKSAKAGLIEKHFGTRTWSRIESLNFGLIIQGRNNLWKELENKDYTFNCYEAQTKNGEEIEEDNESLEVNMKKESEVKGEW